MTSLRQNPVELLTIARPNPLKKRSGKRKNTSTKLIGHNLEADEKGTNMLKRSAIRSSSRRTKTSSHRNNTTSSAKRKTTRSAKPETKLRSFQTSTTKKKSPAKKRRPTKKSALKSSRRSARSMTRSNPSALGATSSSRSKSSKKVGRKQGLPKSVLRAIRSYGPDRVYIVRGGKQIKIEAQKSSSEFKKAKKEGLTGKFGRLYSKKNDHNVLHIVSVRDAFNKQEPATEKEVQQALNAWAGAYEGGHLNRVDVQRSFRSNPMPIMALGSTMPRAFRSNPAPVSMGFFMGSSMQTAAISKGIDSVTTGHKVAIGAGAFAGGLVATNLVASTALKIMKIDSARTNKSGKRYAAEIGGHLIAAIPGIYGLVRTHGNKIAERCFVKENAEACAKMETQIRAASMGWLGGVAGAAIARLVMPEAIANSFMGGIMRGTNIGNDAIFAETAKAANSTAGLHGRKKIFLNGLGKSSSAKSHSRRSARAMGDYFETAMGEYFTTNKDAHDSVGNNGIGKYIIDHSLAGRNLKPRSMRGVSAMGLYTQTSRPDNVKMSRGPEDTLGVRTQPEIISGGAFNYRPGASTDILKELQGIECLDSNELMMEGLDSTALEGTYYIRALPDYARQIAQNNIGVIVGNSQVLQGSMLVQLYTDPLQMVNRTQIGGQPDVPRGAAHARRFGVFSNGIFNSTLPAVDNGYTFMDGNVKV